MQAVILAGGQGSRLKTLTADTPKPMLVIGDKPLLEHQIISLKQHGITEIFLTVNYRKEVIQNFFGNGSKWGVSLSYYEEQEPLGTVGGVKALEDKLKDNFLVLYGDVMMDVDLTRLLQFHQNKQSECTLVLHPNDHPYDSDLVDIDKNQQVCAFHSKPHDPGKYYRNLVNAGLYVLTKKTLQFLEKGKKADFGKDVFPILYKKIKMFGYNTSEYLKDMGTQDRLQKVSSDYLSGKTKRRNLGKPQKAIFLDRDGVLNPDNHLISKPEDFTIYDFTGRAIKTINESEYLAIVVTNQPVVARNLCSEDGLRVIHNKLDAQLSEHKAWVDALYYCPHHPDKGYPEENPIYKIDCDCRKPKPGMLLQAASEFSIDLAASFIIGDTERDIEAGKRAGVTTIGVLTGKGFQQSKTMPHHLFGNLLEAVNFVLAKP